MLQCVVDRVKRHFAYPGQWWLAGLMAAVMLHAGAAAPAQSIALRQATREAWAASDEPLDSVIESLKHATTLGGSGPEIAAIRRELDTYESLQRQRDTRTAAALARTMEKLRQEVADGDLTKALGTAVEAHGLSPDPNKFIARPDIQSLIAASRQQALSHEADHQWVEALALYRRLNLLFEEDNRYDDDLKRIARRLRVLRLYAPEKWFAMQVDYAKAHAEDAPRRWTSDEQEGWEKELKGVTLSQLLQAMGRAARQHVEPCDYEQLLLGGIEAVAVLLDSPALTESLPQLANDQKRKRFADYLDQMHQQIDRRLTDMTHPEAVGLISRMLTENRLSVNLPEEVLVHEFGEGAMATLDDFSNIIWPAAKAQFERTTRGAFSGVGIQITLADDELTVVSPLEGTPAQRAGIRPGEKIVEIDGRPTTGIRLDQAVDRITGPAGSRVTLGIRTPGSPKVRQVTLTRARIEIHSVKGWTRKPGGEWDFYIDPNHRIGYMRLTSFGPKTSDEMDQAVRAMRADRGLDALILDLRFNPGGLLSAAIAVGNRFLDDGVIVASHGATQQIQSGMPVTRRGETWQARADVNHTYGDFPVIVLINKGSASASEIVAGALQDHHRALILGQRSYGKGSVQQVFDLAAYSAKLKLTTQYYMLPSNRIIHRRPRAHDWGIHPDIHVRMTDREVSRLIKARMVLDVLKSDDEDELDPVSVIGTNDEEEDPDEQLPELTDANDILRYGLDLQLEAALLLLKARLIGEEGMS